MLMTSRGKREGSFRKVTALRPPQTSFEREQALSRLEAYLLQSLSAGNFSTVAAVNSESGIP
jgi:hypothetical protein